MNSLSQNRIYYGSDAPLPETLPLRAGPLSLIYDNGSLRMVKLGGQEVLHQIYSAVRDQNWGTIPGQLSDVRIDRQPASFHIHYRSEHKHGEIHFVWTGDISGTPDGTVTFSMDGAALSTFNRNRIGFCILHPINCAGKACTIEDVDGNTYEGAFPREIAPHQPFLNLRKITHEVLPGVQAEVCMEGDTFEMEDQRNWTDASFKTYCTPLGLPFPVTVEAGMKISQKITLRLIGGAPKIETASGGLTFNILDETTPLPDIGLGAASHGQPLTERDIERLKALNLSHLRVDVKFAQPDYEAKFRQAAQEAAAIGVGLEVALFLTDNAEAELATFRLLLEQLQPRISRWSVFHQKEKSTTTKWVMLARERLGEWAERASVGAGTDAFFTELNRERPPVEVADFVTFSNNATVHAVDNASVTETLLTQAETVRSAKAFANGLPVVVSPITFRMRWNPNATGPEPATPPGELPPQVDARQMSLFGAGWTAGSIKYMAESGTASVTYYETTGWRGVMETAKGSPVPEKFHSIPGGVFPLYHIFADIGEFKGGEAVRSQSSDLLAVDGLALRKGSQTRLLLANFTPDKQTVLIPGLSGSWILKLLDETNAEAAMSDPDAYRAQAGQQLEAGADGLRLTLPPFAVVRVDG